MPFEKGHKQSRGPRKARHTNPKHSIKRYANRQWERVGPHKTMDIDEVNHRLYNDLPLDDLIDEIINKHKRK